MVPTQPAIGYYREIGEALGYPPCCTEYFIKRLSLPVEQRKIFGAASKVTPGFIACPEHDKQISLGGIEAAKKIVPGYFERRANKNKDVQGYKQLKQQFKDLALEAKRCLKEGASQNKFRELSERHHTLKLELLLKYGG